jgi:hypothetical protein
VKKFQIFMVIVEKELLLVTKVVSDVLATFGIYPQASITVDKDGKETNRKERTEWQEGWNAAYMEISGKIHDQFALLEKGMSQELALLLIADVGWLQKDGKFQLNMNDTFYYACADSEEVGADEIKEVAGYFAKYGYKGITYWVSKKRGELPQIPRYKKEVEDVRKMEEELSRRSTFPTEGSG